VSDYNNFWHSQQSVYASLKDGFISHLTYLVQLPYLGKSQNTKMTNLAVSSHSVSHLTERIWFSLCVSSFWLVYSL